MKTSILTSSIFAASLCASAGTLAAQSPQPAQATRPEHAASKSSERPDLEVQASLVKSFDTNEAFFEFLVSRGRLERADLEEIRQVFADQKVDFRSPMVTPTMTSARKLEWPSASLEVLENGDFKLKSGEIVRTSTVANPVDLLKKLISAVTKHSSLLERLWTTLVPSVVAQGGLRPPVEVGGVPLTQRLRDRANNGPSQVHRLAAGVHGVGARQLASDADAYALVQTLGQAIAAPSAACREEFLILIVPPGFVRRYMTGGAVDGAARRWLDVVRTNPDGSSEVRTTKLFPVADATPNQNCDERRRRARTHLTSYPSAVAREIGLVSLTPAVPPQSLPRGAPGAPGSLNR